MRLIGVSVYAVRLQAGYRIFLVFFTKKYNLMKVLEKYIFLSVLLFLAGIAAPAERVSDTENDTAIAACLPGRTFRVCQDIPEVGQTLAILKHAFHEAIFAEESEVDHQETEFQGKEQKHGFLYLAPGFLSLAYSSGKINIPFKGKNYLPYQFSHKYILFESLLI